MNEQHDLSRYVQVDISTPRVARVWQAIVPRIERGRSPSRRWLAPLLLAGALGAAGVVTAISLDRTPDAASVWENAALETKGDSLSVRLEDSSRIELAAESRVELSESAPDAVRLRLRRGSVRCDVTHREGRRFSVEALGIEVRVIGTLFSVAIGAGERQVEVAVERGSVEVRSLDDAGAYRRISAGERWSVALPELSAAPSAEAAPSVEAAPSAEAAPSVAPETTASGTELRPVKPRDEPRGDSVGPATGDEADSAGHAQTATARELLDLANLARRSGDLAAAVRAYELLLSKHPTDARVGLAAFELGRLRLERLGNPAGAVSALERAIARAPSPGLREDAMARLVQAHAALGDGARCRRTRDKYLAEYPGGVHVNAVKSRCGER
jgi:transmembrane sensor